MHLKICYVAIDVAVPHSRGASTHVYEIAKHLTRLGHEVYVVSRRISFSQLGYEVLNGFHVHRIYRGILAPLPFSSYQRLDEQREDHSLVQKLYEKYLFTLYPLYGGLVVSRVIRKHNIEIIIERETSFGAGAIASIITKKPAILELIGPRYSRLSFKKSKKILAYTESMLHSSVPRSKLVLVTAGVDVEIFKPNPNQKQLIREKYGLRDSIVIGYIGTFATWHGIDELIDASARVLKRFPDVRFLMVGPYFKHAKEVVQKRGLTDAYVFTGPVPYNDVPIYINSSDILVAPYDPVKSELRRKYGIGSPLKVFEYMACGKPLITTSVAPITQIVQNKKTGILVPPGDSSALKKAIIRLIEKPELGERIGKAAREEVEKHYSWETFAQNLEKVLKEVIKAA